MQSATEQGHRADCRQKQFTISAFDISTFFFFAVWTLVSCPPNIIFQTFLEEKFPANKINPQQPEQKTLDKTNTAKKLCLDQTICATLNTVGYIAALAAYRGKDGAGVIKEVQKVRTCTACKMYMYRRLGGF